MGGDSGSVGGEMARMRVVPAMERRSRAGELLRSLGSDPVVIARRGRGVAVMLSVDAWNLLQDDIDELHGMIRVLEKRLLLRGEELPRTRASR